MLGPTIVLKILRRSDIINEDVQRCVEPFPRAWLVGAIALGVQDDHREPTGGACLNAVGKVSPDLQYTQFQRH